jgi:hypothetical protein
MGTQKVLTGIERANIFYVSYQLILRIALLTRQRLQLGVKLPGNEKDDSFPVLAT